jgi:preprotein translocase subunit YajC
MDKKNIITFLVIIIVIVLAFMVFMKVKDQKENEKQVPLTPSEMEINKAVTTDTTQDINANINSINVDDIGLEEDLNSIDTELEKL